MSNEKKNVFERAKPQTTLADDRKNSFQRHQEVVDANRRNTAVHDARVQHKEDVAAKWTKHAPRAAGGTQLPADLATLKAASDRSRTAPKQPPIIINTSVLFAVTEHWRLHFPNGQAFYDSPFNHQSLGHAVQHHIAHGAPITPELIELAYQGITTGNHYEAKPRTDRDGHIVRLRGEATRPAPTMFPRVVWSDELALQERAQHEAAGAAAAAEVQRALSLPFDQLEKEATKDRILDRRIYGSENIPTV